MPETKTKKFNLLQYVYGRLFAEQCLTGKAEGLLIEETCMNTILKRLKEI